MTVICVSMGSSGMILTRNVNNFLPPTDAPRYTKFLQQFVFYNICFYFLLPTLSFTLVTGPIDCMLDQNFIIRKTTWPMGTYNVVAPYLINTLFAMLLSDFSSKCDHLLLFSIYASCLLISGVMHESENILCDINSVCCSTRQPKENRLDAIYFSGMYCKSTGH